MAKEKVKAEAKPAVQEVRAAHGVVRAKCNKCGAEVDVPTARMYAKVAPARPAEGEKKIPALIDPDTKEVLKPERTIPARPYIPRRPLHHGDLSGCGCDGTFATINLHKPKLHKSSKQRHGNKE